MRCLPCEPNGLKIESWAPEYLPGLKYLVEAGAMCQLHASEAVARLKTAKNDPLKYTLKPFLPPIPKQEVKNYTEREPNDGSLIE